MKTVIGWKRDREWKFRHVRCNYCGNEWWETVEPKRYATTDLSCACNQGKPWKPTDT